MKGIYQLPSGHWRVSVQVDGRRTRTVVATREEAEQMRDALLAQILDRTLVPVDGSSIYTLGKRFLHSRSGNRSYSDDIKRWTRHIQTAPFATVAPDATTRRDVLDWLEKLRRRSAVRIGAKGKEKSLGKTLSWQTRKHLRNLLNAF